MLTICITGHRDLLNPEDVRKDIFNSLNYFRKIDKELKAISAIAIGADTIFAEEVIKQNIPLDIVLPFQLEEYRKDFSDTDLEKFESLLFSRNYEPIEKDIKTSEERKKAYLKAGQVIVDRSDIVLAVWDGKESNGTGGTGEIVQYARQKNKQLHIIKALRNPDHEESVPVDEAQISFDKVDREAITYKKNKFEPAWITGIIAGLLAVFCFAIKMAFEAGHSWEFIISVTEMFFLALSFIALAVYAKKWKLVFLKKRRNTEYLRPLVWYKDAGIPIPEIVKSQYLPEQEILDIEKKLREKSILKIENISNGKRVAWCLAEEQIFYHTNTRIIPFHKKLERTEQWLKWVKIIFFLVAALNFLHEIVEHYHIHTRLSLEVLEPYLLFLALTLPPTYAALEGVKYFTEWKRDIAISEKTVFELEESKKRILACTDETSLTAETKILRDILEMENSNWLVRYQEREVGAKI